MPVKYGGGNPLRADTLFGWGRHPVEVGLAERRTGSICLGAQSAFSGRHRWEEEPPEAAGALRRLAAAPAQHAPPLRPLLASTRRTATAAWAAVRAHGYRQAHLPAPATMAAGLNRRGVRRRTVVKATPHKQRAETDAIFAHMEKKTTQR